jgi:cell fate regulator YaaT (PSP1 superfamily)
MRKFVVRYGSMRQLGVMTSRIDALTRGDRVIARTKRGMEIGDVLCEASEDALSHLDEPEQGQILRSLSSDDENELAHIETRRDEVFQACRRHIQEQQLEMQLVDVEQLFGGERIIVYYIAEQRVDFRELVRLLASELQTRIEMRQIGVRDEAKLLADYGDCGKPVCCNTHLSKMPPVSMKMAKIQKATLDPNKISGRCGRLKCCLRYEYDTYEEIYKQLPPIGSDILTREGQCRVLNQEILTEQLLVETEDHRRRLVHASEVLSVIRRGSNRSGGKGKKNSGGSRRKPDNANPTDSAPSPPPKSRRLDSKSSPQTSSKPQPEAPGTPPSESAGNGQEE